MRRIQMSNPESSTENATENKAITFSIAGLLALTTVIGITLIPVSIWGADGIVGSVLLALLFVCWLAVWKFEVGLFTKLLLWSGLLLVFLAVIIPPVGHPRRPSVRAQCLNNMRQLALACHNYHSAYGRLPPPFTVDDDGKPLHSWRVLILPFIEEQALYEDLDLTKPWNDPVNMKHAHRMPDIFLCPTHGPTSAGRFAHVKTPYVAVVGKETIWDPTAGGLTFNSVKDGSSNTIMFVESDAHQVHWMSPMDFKFSDIVAMNEKGETDMISSNHQGGSNVVLADGSACFVLDTVKAADIRAASTIQGGEVVNVHDW